MAQEYVEIVTQAYAVARGGSVKNIYNIYHFRRTNSVLPVSKANIESQFYTSIQTVVLAGLSVDYTETNVTVRFFDDATDAPVAFPETGVGAIAGERLQDFVAAVIQLKSGFRGKSGRGSKHYSPIAEADTNGDVLDASGITQITAIGNAILAGFTDADGNVWVPVIKSSKPPAQYLVNPVTVNTHDVISVVLNKTLGTMKRRKVKTVN